MSPKKAAQIVATGGPHMNLGRKSTADGWRKNRNARKAARQVLRRLGGKVGP